MIFFLMAFFIKKGQKLEKEMQELAFKNTQLESRVKSLEASKIEMEMQVMQLQKEEIERLQNLLQQYKEETHSKKRNTLSTEDIEKLMKESKRKKIEVEKSKFQKFHQLDAFSKQFRMFPYRFMYNNDMRVGFRLVAIRKSSAFHGLKIKNGDVIIAYNSFPTTKAVEFYDFLKTIAKGEKIEVLIKRRNEFMVLEIIPIN